MEVMVDGFRLRNSVAAQCIVRDHHMRDIRQLPSPGYIIPTPANKKPRTGGQATVVTPQGGRLPTTRNAAGSVYVPMNSTTCTGKNLPGSPQALRPAMIEAAAVGFW